MVWSTLEEVAEWLSEASGDVWTARKVLNAALKHPTEDRLSCDISNKRTAVFAAPPGETEFEFLTLSPLSKKHPPYRLPWRIFQLRQSHVHQ